LKIAENQLRRSCQCAILDSIGSEPAAAAVDKQLMSRFVPVTTVMERTYMDELLDESVGAATPFYLANPDRSVGKRWKHETLFSQGYVSVPTQFLRLYAELKPFPLTHGEATFVLHLMQFKWDEQAPFPSYAKIARQMGVSDKQARRYAASLETKKYLHRYSRIGSTNKFDLSPLFDALATAAAARDKQAKATMTRPRG
jgi:hypothetical protein